MGAPKNKNTILGWVLRTHFFFFVMGANAFALEGTPGVFGLPSDSSLADYCKQDAIAAILERVRMRVADRLLSAECAKSVEVYGINNVIVQKRGWFRRNVRVKLSYSAWIQCPSEYHMGPIVEVEYRVSDGKCHVTPPPPPPSPEQSYFFPPNVWEGPY